MRTLVVLAMLSFAVPVAAQQSDQVIEPGMSRAEVVERLGQPAAVRSTGDYTYLFFRNGCERECGMSDLVTLEHDGVVDAIFRAPNRRFTGTSTSPTRVPPSQRGSRLGAQADRGALRVPEAANPESQRREPAVIGDIRVQRAAEAEVPEADPAPATPAPASPAQPTPSPVQAAPTPESVRPAPDSVRPSAPARRDTVSASIEPVPAAPATATVGPQPD